MLAIQNIVVRFGGFDLLKGVSFLITKDHKIGLIGKNGAGKSTLLKIIAGAQQPDAGSISKANSLTIGYLPQHMTITDSCTLKEEAQKAFAEIMQLKQAIANTQTKLDNSTDYESDAFLQLSQQLYDLYERYYFLGGDGFEANLEQTLFGLGFERSDFTKPTSAFSGGWRMRIELAKILLQHPDVLLLDEPTNHLDIESIEWLEHFLKNYQGAVVLVSHDKRFLDNVINRTIEISLGRMLDQNLTYTKFKLWKEERREQQLAAYKNQQKQISETESFIDRFRYKPTKSNQVQSRIKQLAKIDRVEIEEEDNKTLHIKFTQTPASGKKIVEAINVSKAYDDKVILKNINLTIERGERVAFVGRNGEGKTTLMRILMGDLPHEGNVTYGHNVKIGYFAQNQAHLLNPKLTVFETIEHIATGEMHAQIRNILGAFKFSGDEVNKLVESLSGGERSRLAMIKLLLEPVNFLALDEPTNHLDIDSKEALKSALKQFQGTMVIVSHDREFLEGLTTCTYEFKNQQVKQHLGPLDLFLASKRIDSLKVLEKPTESQSVDKKVNAPTAANNKAKQQAITKEEKNIERIEAKLKELEQIISNPTNETQNPNIFNEYQTLLQQHAEALQRWETLHE